MLYVIYLYVNFIFIIIFTDDTTHNVIPEIIHRKLNDEKILFDSLEL